MFEQSPNPESKFEFDPKKELTEKQLEHSIAQMKVFLENKDYQLNAAEIAANLKLIAPDKIEKENISKLQGVLEEQRKKDIEQGREISQIECAELLHELFGLTKEELGISDENLKKAEEEVKRIGSSFFGEENTDSMGIIERDMLFAELRAVKRMFPEFNLEQLSSQALWTAKYDMHSIREFNYAGDFASRMAAQCAELFPDKVAELDIDNKFAELLKGKLKNEDSIEAIEMAANLKRIEGFLNKK